MRPWRQFFVSGLSLFALFCLFYNSHAPNTLSNADPQPHPGRRLSAFFSFRTPSSLFPPSAVISLTFENSTFFSARPANFGPLLPSNGLSGQLWVGNGFDDESLKRRGIATGNEGELGCSDVPSLTDGQWHSDVDLDSTSGADPEQPDVRLHAKRHGLNHASSPQDSDGFLATGSDSFDHAQPVVAENDGTDDYLHRLRSASSSARNYPGTAKGKLSEHADIQSLQESAEIRGKIALLSRGGCGFFEKVKWAQRRGAIAVIVADNLPGRPLVTMNARGDATNITIPSIFTHHTTAHVLASLIPPGFDFVTPSLGKYRTPDAPDSTALSKGNAEVERAHKGKLNDQRTFTATTSITMPTPTKYPLAHKAATSSSSSRDPDSATSDQSGWLGSLWYLVTFGYGVSKESTESINNRRPPSSGHLDWFMVEDWDNDEPKLPASEVAATQSQKPHDAFVIGVQDWRDPDVVSLGTPPTDADQTEASQTTLESPDVAKVNAITPGSGEYSTPDNLEDASTSVPKPSQGYDAAGSSNQPANEESQGWLVNLGWNGGASDAASYGAAPPSDAVLHDTHDTNKETNPTPPPEMHEGLWVTLTPSSIGTSPFLDTLIVLVISPLVTLTIVYAMLLLRSRIRRRRWRAPKSIVERLPVRVFHTRTPRSASPSPAALPTGPCTSTTPLLANSRGVEPRPRPRSRTTSSAPETLAVPSSYGSLDPSLAEQEKLDAGLAEWRRRYGGKQVECIVCLEEYVDGVSKVMSLPCGHEFHADCITPWLTTRRRTCPICKGDVVRSLAKSPSSSMQASHLNDESDEDVLEGPADRLSVSGSAALPIASTSYGSSDLEQANQHTSQSVPTLRMPRNIRNSFQTLLLHRGVRSPPPQDTVPQDEGRDR